LTHAAFAGDSELWDRIPPVLSVFPEAVPSPAAMVLVTANTPSGPQPIIVSQRYGQGKVLAVFTDSLWKWHLHPDSADARPYQRFWNQVIDWLLPEEEDIARDRLDIFADKESLVLGEQITISARLGAQLQAGKPTVKCDIELPEGSRAPFAMRANVVTTSSGKAYPGFLTTYDVSVPGLHRVVATASFEGRKVTSEPISFFVKPFSAESVPRPVNAAVLKSIARNSRGRFFENPEAMNEALCRMEFRKIEEQSSDYRSLWQTPGVIACLIGLALLAWIVRKFNSMP